MGPRNWPKLAGVWLMVSGIAVLAAHVGEQYGRTGDYPDWMGYTLGAMSYIVAYIASPRRRPDA